VADIEILSGQGAILPGVSDEVRALIIADLELEMESGLE
jgi:hypothetical protein